MTGSGSISHNPIVLTDEVAASIKASLGERTMSGFVTDVLKLFANHDICSSLQWSISDKGTVVFNTNANDLFAWGSADGEDVTPENLPLLEQAINECLARDAITGAIYGCDLFAARVRKMRPQGAAYPDERSLWPLFDACGPERKTGLGNPYKPGERKPRTVASAG